MFGTWHRRSEVKFFEEKRLFWTKLLKQFFWEKGLFCLNNRTGKWFWRTATWTAATARITRATSDIISTESRKVADNLRTVLWEFVSKRKMGLQLSSALWPKYRATTIASPFSKNSSFLLLNKQSFVVVVVVGISWSHTKQTSFQQQKEGSIQTQTLVTLVGLLATVRSHVFSQITCLSGWTIALATLVGLLSTVYLHMSS